MTRFNNKDWTKAALEARVCMDTNSTALRLSIVRATLDIEFDEDFVNCA
jgi:hypothetical protein